MRKKVDSPIWPFFYITHCCLHQSLIHSLLETSSPMGCNGSTAAKGNEPIKKIMKPKPWKHSEPLTEEQLERMRDEFWDTAPHYGGRKEIWDALRAASEADLSLAQTIVDSAGIIVQKADLTICYDERGAKYELPKYVMSKPTNMVRGS
ncbi:ubiquitin domain-containing protein [Artemisia annua]|uniref:Ubiquitin domain-containing protein n=1 Tax=Artemisia annua TaxID=35608 RepID=A0A2U1LN61_ARTAN|nr:ubiquitin domain-containing protein [Artemisia annua]